MSGCIHFAAADFAASPKSVKVRRVKRSKLEIGHLGLARPHFEELRVPDDYNVSRRAQFGRRGKEAGKGATALGDCGSEDKKQNEIQQKSMSMAV